MLVGTINRRADHPVALAIAGIVFVLGSVMLAVQRGPPAWLMQSLVVLSGLTLAASAWHAMFPKRGDPWSSTMPTLLGMVVLFVTFLAVVGYGVGYQLGTALWTQATGVALKNVSLTEFMRLTLRPGITAPLVAVAMLGIVTFSWAAQEDADRCRASVLAFIFVLVGLVWGAHAIPFTLKTMRSRWSPPPPPAP